MDKTHPLLMGMTMDVTYIWSHALEFGWVRLPLANHNEKGLLQHLESYTGVLLGKTPPLLMGMTKDVL